MRRFALGLAATALSGFVYGLAFPPSSWRLLAWVALAPFFWAIRGVSVGGALFLGWFWAVFASCFVADALPRAVETYFLQPRATSIAFAVLVWSLTGSIYSMGFAWVYRALSHRWTGASLALLAGIAWALSEMLRGRLWTGTEVFTGNPWALVAYSQVGWLPVVQVASIGGVYAVSFLIAWVNAASVELAIHRRLRVLALPGLATAASVLWGAWSLRPLPTPGQPAGRVAIVQANLDLGSQWRSSHYGQNLDTHLLMTAKALEQHPDVVVWPESALTFFLEDEPLYQRAIARLLETTGADLVVGGPRRVPDRHGRSERYTNSVFVLGADGTLRGRYDKEHLVPFAEYFPLARLDFLRRRFERVRVFEHGRQTAPLETPIGRAGMLVCNEAMLPEVAGARARAGAEILMAPSNDTWIQDPLWAERMFDLVSLRAVEQRRTLVRASSSGPSAVIDPMGRIVARSEPFSREVIVADVEATRDLSLYARMGDVPWVLLGLGTGAALLRRRSLTRPKPESTTHAP